MELETNIGDDGTDMASGRNEAVSSEGGVT